MNPDAERSRIVGQYCGDIDSKLFPVYSFIGTFTNRRTEVSSPHNVNFKFLNGRERRDVYKHYGNISLFII